MKKAKRILIALTAVLLISLLPLISVSALKKDGAGNAIGSSEKGLDIEGDYYYFFDSSTSNEEVIKGKVGGDIIALGGTTQIEANVGGSIRAASLMSLIIDNSTARNITVASVQVDIGANTKSKAVYTGAGTFSFSGTCEYLEVWATDVYIYGTITESAKIHADNVYFADTCDVNKVTVEGSDKPKYFENNNLGKLKDYTEVEKLKDKISFSQTYTPFQRYMANLLYTLPAAIILTLLICLLFGKQVDEAGNMFKNTTGRHIGFGVMGAFLIPIALFFALAIPYVSTAALVLGIVYVLLVIVATSFTAASIGRIVMPSLNKYLSAVIGVTAATLLTLLTTINTLFTLFSLIYIFGYVVCKLFFKKPELPPLNTIQM